jgi:hypothetical protein
VHWKASAGKLRRAQPSFTSGVAPAARVSSLAHAPCWHSGWGALLEGQAQAGATSPVVWPACQPFLSSSYLHDVAQPHHKAIGDAARLADLHPELDRARTPEHRGAAVLGVEVEAAVLLHGCRPGAGRGKRRSGQRARCQHNQPDRSVTGASPPLVQPQPSLVHRARPPSEVLIRLGS